MLRDRVPCTSWPLRLPSRPVVVTAVLISALAASAAVAQQGQPSTPSAPQQRLKADRERLEEAQRRAKSLQSDVAQLDEERAKLSQRLQETARLVQRSEAQLSSIEARRDELESQERLLQGSLAQRHGSIAKLLSAMQRMGRNPPPVIITRREDALEMVRSAMLLARAFPELKLQAEELGSRLTDLARVMGEIKSERDKLEAETSRLKDAQARLANLMEVRRQSLSERQQELDEVRRTAAEISKSVSDLGDLIAKLDRAVAEKTGLGTYEQEIRQAAAAPADPTAVAPGAADPGTAGGPAQPPKESLPQVALLAPQGSVFSSNHNRIKPAIPFHQARAQLPLPAQGQRVLSFGDKTQYGSSSKGIVLETRHGARITAPADGWVVYAGEFRTYGQLLIINAGGGYHILLAGLSQIDVALGQFVLASEPVGSMRTAPKGKAQDNAPVLYVEFRKEGRPIDPEPWWAEGSRKVQG